MPYVTVTWTTDEPSTSQVEYGATTAYGGATPLDSALVVSHTVVIPDLPAGVPTYHYRVISTDGSGNTTVSGDFTFSTVGYGTPQQARCVNYDERIQYLRPDGSRFWLHAPPATVVMAEEGLGTPPLDYISDRAPFQHGISVRDFFAGPRSIQLTVLQNFYSRAGYWNGRASLLDALRPNRVTDFNQTGKLLYFMGNGQRRQLDVLLESGPGFAPKQQGWRSWSFTEVLRFLAPDPAWYDPTQQSVVFTQGVAVGELVFPVEFPFVLAGFGSIADITYLGTWLEYPTVIVTGPITGPSVLNLTTNKQLALATSVPSGMSVTFTLRGRKTVTRSDGLNLLPFLTSDSDLVEFALLPDPEAADGVNQIQVVGSETTPDTAVTIRWYNRYFGI